LALDRNELFREVNERIADVGFDALDNSAQLREFLCECGRPGCRELFTMSFDDFRAARRSLDCFIVVPGHDDFEHDEVIERGSGYWVVQSLHEHRDERAS